MPFRLGAYLIAGAMLVLATSACSSSNSDGLYGIWITPGNLGHLSFNEDNSWSFLHPEDPDRIRAFGRFTFEGELLTLSTDPDSRRCSRLDGAYEAALTGTYDATFTAEGDLELNDIEDPCVQRRVEFRGTLVPYSP